MKTTQIEKLKNENKELKATNKELNIEIDNLSERLEINQLQLKETLLSKNKALDTVSELKREIEIIVDEAYHSKLTKEELLVRTIDMFKRIPLVDWNKSLASINASIVETIENGLLEATKQMKIAKNNLNIHQNIQEDIQISLKRMNSGELGSIILNN